MLNPGTFSDYNINKGAYFSSHRQQIGHCPTAFVGDRWRRFMNNIPPSGANAPSSQSSTGVISGFCEGFHSVVILNDLYFAWSSILQNPALQL